MAHAVEIPRLSRSLERDASGIWRVPSTAASSVSFPDDGHEGCFDLEDASFWFEHRNACILHALQRFGVGGPLLDVGGGNGAVSSYLERQGIPTVLLEPGPEGAQNARRRGLANVVCATLENAGFADGAFPAAGLFDVIEHVDDDVGFLRSVRRVLAPGGVLCVTVPAHAWLWSGEDEHAGHFRRYARRDASRVLEQSGFDVRYATYFFAPLVAPIFLLRSLRHRIARRSSAEIKDGAKGEHVPSPTARRIMDGLLGPERSRIRDGRTIPFGTSCLVVAVAS